MYFKDIIGQEEIKKRLIHSARTGVIPHAQLFTEQVSAGAFPLALAYARYLNCTNRTETDSCGHCPSCLKYNELAHPDLHFVFPIVSKKDKKKDVCDDYLTEWRGFLKNRPYFDIDGWLDYIDAGNSQALIYSKESDEIIRKLSLKIYEATYRILLVWLPEKLHQTCANKLLKAIEEPPRNTVILMVSELPDLVLGTILSRAQRINVRGIHPKDIASSMISRFNLTPEDAKHVAHLANGSYLKAVEAIRHAGCEVVGMVASYTYGFDLAEKAFAEAGVELTTLTNYEAVVGVAMQQDYIKPEDKPLLDLWRSNPSQWGQK